MKIDGISSMQQNSYDLSVACFLEIHVYAADVLVHVVQ